MKIRILFLCWMCGICFGIKGQDFKMPAVATDSSALPAPIYNYSYNSLQKNLSAQKIGYDSLQTSLNLNALYLQKSRAHQINAFVLMAGGSMMSAVGIRNGIMATYNTMEREGPGKEQNNYQRFSGNRMALTGLVMMAGSIPYFISALKNKNKAGLKFTSQKNSFGTNHKACKGVTSLTYAIPLGRRTN